MTCDAYNLNAVWQEGVAGGCGRRVWQEGVAGGCGLYTFYVQAQADYSTVILMQPSPDFKVLVI